MILEVFDETNEVKFIFDDINIPTTVLHNFPDFKGDVIKNMKELHEIIKQEDIKIIQKIESSMPKGHSGGTDVKYPKPIELDEQ